MEATAAELGDSEAPTATQLAPDDTARRRELARYVRFRREQLQPEDVGLPRGERRRVARLRRYEVADLAGVSDTWFTWLEPVRRGLGRRCGRRR